MPINKIKSWLFLIYVTYIILVSILKYYSSRVFNFFMLMKGYDSFMKWAILKSPYLSNTLWLQNKNLIFRFSIFQSTCLLICKVAFAWFVEIIECELEFPMVAMDELDPCREPLPRESRYSCCFLYSRVPFTINYWSASHRTSVYLLYSSFVSLEARILVYDPPISYKIIRVTGAGVQ